MPGNIAIITARGGSKRIPGKNIKLFLGKPIIHYSIETVISSGLFEKVIVSTDNEEIANVAKGAGAEVPFLRSEENSNDYAGTADVITEVIQQLNKRGEHFDNICCVYPTAPFITPKRLLEAYDLLTNKEFTSVITVCGFSFPIQRSLQRDESGTFSMVWPENLTVRSQDLPERYHDAGQFYWVRSEEFIKNNRLYTEKMGAIILNEMEVQDIDNISDWNLAELKYKLANS